MFPLDRKMFTKIWRRQLPSIFKRSLTKNMNINMFSILSPAINYPRLQTSPISNAQKLEFSSLSDYFSTEEGEKEKLSDRKIY